MSSTPEKILVPDYTGDPGLVPDPETTADGGTIIPIKIEKSEASVDEEDLPVSQSAREEIQTSFDLVATKDWYPAHRDYLEKLKSEIDAANTQAELIKIITESRIDPMQKISFINAIRGVKEETQEPADVPQETHVAEEVVESEIFPGGEDIPVSDDLREKINTAFEYLSKGIWFGQDKISFEKLKDEVKEATTQQQLIDLIEGSILLDSHKQSIIGIIHGSAETLEQAEVGQQIESQTETTSESIPSGLRDVVNSWFSQFDGPFYDKLRPELNEFKLELNRIQTRSELIAVIQGSMSWDPEKITLLLSGVENYTPDTESPVGAQVVVEQAEVVPSVESVGQQEKVGFELSQKTLDRLNLMYRMAKENEKDLIATLKSKLLNQDLSLEQALSEVRKLEESRVVGSIIGGLLRESLQEDANKVNTKDEVEVVPIVAEVPGPSVPDVQAGDLGEPDVEVPAPDAVPPTTPAPEAVDGASAGSVDVEKENAEKLKELDGKIAEARLAYATEVVAHKKNIREKQSKWKKMMSTLSEATGFEKRMPDAVRPAELIEAEKAYIQAKKQKAIHIMQTEEAYVTMSNEPEAEKKKKKAEIKEQYISLAEDERDQYVKALQEAMNGGAEKDIEGGAEKSRLKKGLEKGLQWWGGLKPWQRKTIGVTVSSGLLFGAMTLGGFGVVAAGSYAGIRAGRSLVSGTLGQGAGEGLGFYHKKRGEKIKEGFFTDERADLSAVDFEKKEKELMDFYEAEERRKKREKIYKTATVIGVAGGTAALSGLLMPHDVPVNAPGQGGNSVPGEHPPVSKPPVPEAIPEKPPVKVELSSKGFIQTIKELQEKTASQYPDGKMPEEVKNFLAKKPEDLAKKFGFYNPDEVEESAVGLKGETLAIDAKGNVSYGHIGGKADTIFDAKKNTIYQYEGKMIDADRSGKVATVAEAPASTGDVATKGFESGLGSDVGTEATYAPDTSPGADTSPGLVETDSESVFERGFSKDTPSSSLGVEDTDIDVRAEDVSHLTSDTGTVGKSMGGPILKESSLINPEKIHEMYPQATVALENNQTVLKWNNTVFAHEGGLENGYKTMVLDKEFQEGAQYKDIRSAFAEIIKSQPVDTEKFARFQIDLKDGMVDVVTSKTDASVSVLLNGQEIGHSVPKGNTFVMKYTGKKSGIFFADNTFEKAFKAAKKMYDPILDPVKFANRKL